VTCKYKLQSKARAMQRVTYSKSKPRIAMRLELGDLTRPRDHVKVEGGRACSGRDGRHRVAASGAGNNDDKRGAYAAWVATRPARQHARCKRDM